MTPASSPDARWAARCSPPRLRCASRAAGGRRLAAWVLAAGLLARTSFAVDPPEAPPGDVSPAENARVVELNEQGNALYAAGDYRRAAERFLQAHAIDADPNLLFNIASCYEALGDLDAALEKYRAFLAAPHADPTGRSRAEAAIARLVELDAPEPLPAAEAREPAPLTPPPSIPRNVIPSPARPDATAPAGAWVPWVGLAGGAALGALGTAFYILGAGDHSELTETAGYGDPGSVAGITRGRAGDLVRSGDTKKAIGVTAASAGATLIVGSIVWWLVDPMASRSTAGLEVAFDPSRTELCVKGVF